MKPTLYLLRGLPGSGKSTLAKSMAKRLGAIHIEADMYFVHDGYYHFNPSRLKDAHTWCLVTAWALLESGRDVIVANTFTQAWEMRPYLDIGFPTDVICCAGNFGSIHGVPQDTIDRMAERWEDFEGETHYARTDGEWHD